jgi:tellurite methyltransferase
MKSLYAISSRKNSYWNGYYNKTSAVSQPSDFAKFVLKKIKKTKGFLIDVGCGNGRDTIFFIKKKIDAFGCDHSLTIIKKNNKIKKVFNKINFCKKEVKLKKNFNFFYARFFIHAITLKEENFFFNNIKKNTDSSCQIYLEFRTDKDPLMLKGKYLSKYERVTDHYRRFINVESFVQRMKKKKINILFLKTSNKFAIFKKHKPHICRVILNYKKK